MNARTRSLGGWAVMLAAVLVCALGGWSYTQVRGDDTLAYAKARDAATADGRSRLARLNSMDGTSAASVKSGLTAWLAASTGPLRTQLERTRKKDTAELTEAGATARGKVTDAALTALDVRAGTAVLIATVDVAVTPAPARAEPSANASRRPWPGPATAGRSRHWTRYRSGAADDTARRDHGPGHLLEAGTGAGAGAGSRAGDGDADRHRGGRYRYAPPCLAPCSRGHPGRRPAGRRGRPLRPGAAIA